MSTVRNWSRVRPRRDRLLKEALAVLERHRNQKDFGLATAISDAKAKEWADYAQDLRDITRQSGQGPLFWPVKPGE